MSSKQIVRGEGSRYACKKTGTPAYASKNGGRVGTATASTPRELVPLDCSAGATRDGSQTSTVGHVREEPTPRALALMEWETPMRISSPTMHQNKGKRHKDGRSTARPPKVMRVAQDAAPAVAKDADACAHARTGHEDDPAAATTPWAPQPTGMLKQADSDETNEEARVQNGTVVYARWEDGVSLNRMTV